jgi:ABC-type nitrate/sulfonate/bicarbonate transport system substrate-binding protein
MRTASLSRRTLLAGSAALAPVVLSRRARAASLAIRVGWATMPGHLIPVLFNDPAQKGLRHYGKSYTVEPILFRGSSPQLMAMAGGELDFFASAASTLALGVTNAHLDLQVVSDIIQDGVPGWHSDTWLVKADGPIHKIEDLKGKRIASNAIGSAADTAMRALLLRHGLRDRRDFVVIQAAFNAMPSLLEKGEIDCAPILMPMMAQMMKTGQYRGLFQGRDIFGASETVFLTAQADYLHKNQAVVADFMEDWVRSRRWFLDPKNRTVAIRIIADFMHMPTSELDYVFTHQDYYRDPWSQPNLPGLQRPIDIAHQIGVLKQAITVNPGHADLSFLDEAKKRITTPA